MPDHLDQTQELAVYVRLPYAVVITVDECGDRRCYVAYHPELRGCMAQGYSPEEAVADLKLAREDYIASLLEDGLPVPPPHGLLQPEILERSETALVGTVTTARSAFSDPRVSQSNWIAVL